MEYHTKTNSTVVLRYVKRWHGKPKQMQVEVELGAKWPRKHTLLDALLADKNDRGECPNHSVYDVKWGLEAILATPDLAKILKKLPSRVTQQEIHRLMQGIEEHVEKTDVKHKYSKSLDARWLFRNSDVVIANGNKVKDVYRAFNSSFPMNPSLIPTQQVVTKPFDDIEELYDNAKGEYKKKIDNILSCCESDINRHLAIVEKVKEYKETPIPEFDELLKSSQNPINKALLESDYSSIQLNSRLFALKELHIRDNMLSYTIRENGKAWSKRFARASSSEDYLFYGFHTLESVKEIRKFNKTLPAMLCDYYLPPRILLACLFVLVLATGCNGSAIRLITRDRIVKTPVGYKLTGLKGKTDRLVQDEVKRKENPLACLALDLLLEHDNNIEKYWVRDNDSVFACFHKQAFSVSYFKSTLDGFIAWHELEYFTIDDLRDVFAQSDFLKHRDPFRVMALLDHSTITSTEEYLKDNVLQMLNEANVVEFMRRLAPSIAFSVDKQNAKRRDFNKNKVDSNLLFPVDKYDNVTDALCDQWLMDDSNITITVNRETIEFCAYQMNYYKTHLSGLISDNDKRFVTYHLPRILFCAALYRIIEASEYSVLLTEYERSANEKSQ